MLKGAMAEISVTPALGGMIPGQFCARWSTGLKDELFARVLLLEDGATRLALLSFDTLCLSDAIVREIRVQSGLDKLLVAATHTHTGGPVEDWGEHLKKDPEYVRWLIKRGVDCLEIARGRLQDVRLLGAEGREERISFHRRYRMRDGSVRTNPGVNNPDIVAADGPIDPTLTLMQVEGADGRLIGTVTNFACHPDVIGTFETEISADFPGELSRSLKQICGEDSVHMFLTAPCGNLNHIDVSGAFSFGAEHYKRMGRILAADVWRLMQLSREFSDLRLQSARTILDLPCRLPSEECLRDARKIVAEERRSHEALIAAADGSLERLFYAQEALRMDEEKETSCALEVASFRIGELLLCALPVELFTEFGLRIRERSTAGLCMISTLSNGSFGYVPTTQALREGGYEAQLCSTSRLAEDAGDRLVDAVEKQACALGF